MIAPAIAGKNLLIAVLLGFLPGLLHSFLQPFRVRHRHIADLVTVLSLFYCWLYLGFGVCGGDLRMGYLLGMLLGYAVCIYTAGKWLQCLFWRFYGLLEWFFLGFKSLFLKFLVFFKKFPKVLFAFKKK